jgi:hypothetical protein
MTRNRAALIGFIAALVLVPATASAAPAYRIPWKLSVVPLQKAQLGPAGASFALNHDGSGPIPNRSASVLLLGAFLAPTSNPLPGNGRLGGYALDYGDPLTGSTGVTEIRTSVEKYKTAANAAAGLRFWRMTDSHLGSWVNSSVLPVTVQKVKPPAVGQQRFASLLTFAATGLNPIVRLDVQATDGRYILGVTVTAGSASAAEGAAPGLLRALDKRLHRLESWHSVGAPAKVPGEREAGQAQGGPEFSAAALQLADVGESYWQYDVRQYASDPFALSRYFMTAGPAGLYFQVDQDLTWWTTATEATYANTYQGQLLDGEYLLPPPSSITPVDLSGLSDPGNGALITGGPYSLALINLTRGQASDRVVAISASSLTASDVQALAEKAAARLDALLP